MNNYFYGDNWRWWYGVVVNVSSDPLQLGRALVRIYGIHGDDIEDRDLPWASVIVPTTSGGVSGIGTNPLLQPGAKVVGFFLDGDRSQDPVIFGSIPSYEGAIPEGVRNSSVTPYQHGISPSVEYSPSQGSSYTNGSLNPDYIGEGYPSEMTVGVISEIIREEAELRGIDPEVALGIYQHEGILSYQSTATGAAAQINGREASFGPYQLYIGGGEGNTYQEQTGRDLQTDNTREGITTQIRFALDRATVTGWSPWYGRLRAGIGEWDGLDGSQAVNNWR